MSAIATSALQPAVRVAVPKAVSAGFPLAGGRVHRLAGLTMGTRWSVAFVGTAQVDIEFIRRGIEAGFDEVIDAMSPWRIDSDISRYNRAPAGSHHTLPSSFAEVLAHAIDVARTSGGAFDPTLGALVDLWGFGPPGGHAQRGFAPPADAAIAAACATGGWQRLGFDAPLRSVRQPGGLRLDLSGIAKGYAVDRTSRWLRAQGIESALVEVGGELRGEGIKADGQPWWVALEAPPGAALPAWRVALHGLAVATSGDYRRSFEASGVRYSHTLDGRSGRPVAHGLASVSVLHAECMAADALATALEVMGLESGLAWADGHGVAARFVQRRADGFEEHGSAALRDLLA